jgi:hypothetical protein
VANVEEFRAGRGDTSLTQDEKVLEERGRAAVRTMAKFDAEKPGGFWRYRDLDYFSTRDDVSQTWRIDGVIPPGITLLVGPPGVGKSLLALSWSHHIANDREWGGRKVRSGSVAYLAPELGLQEFRRRLRACDAEFGPVGSNSWGLAFRTQDLRQWKLNGPPDDLEECVAGLSAQLSGDEGLIVIDTLAEHFHGDENTSAHMNPFVDALRQVQRRCSGCDILVVHHTARRGSEERGHSSLSGAVDCSYRLDHTLKLTCLKPPRSAPRPEPIQLQIKQVEIFPSDGNLPAATSAVMVVATGASGPANRGASPQIRRELAALQAAGERGLTMTEWCESCRTPTTTLSRRAKKALASYVRRVGSRYELTDEGRQFLDSPSSATSTATTPLEGVGGGSRMAGGLLQEAGA